ncbi:hypothetical protein PLESTB_000555800 [Pleodorina starrii]|uniref:F-box domain-containing protein n=1 Tax=Pleodorina starrii TaxID=330485 RepID=A0A9W6F106_9CHLO|nr:hypothetical protein PLESTB_000555800 [Pleodorina starrii]GLC74536.1 hypothetical protein PLESTF_001524600 [Pleodorina starrii]
MDAAENGGEDADGTHPAQPCNKPYDWGASLPSEFLQEIARHAGVQSWPTLRCVCQNWRRGISQAVRTVKLTAHRSTAPALQPPAEPPAAADAPRPARRGAAAGRPAGRGGAAANQQQHQLVATGVPFTAAQCPQPETAQEPLRYQEPHPQHHPDPHQHQHHNHQHQQPTAATAARGFAASSGRPPPHPHPPDANALNAIHHQPAAAAIGGPDSATAATATAGGGGGGDASFDRIATVVRRPPPVFEPPHHDLESLACVFNLHRQSTVAAVAAAAAAAAARLQGEASDSQAAGVASSVGSSSIVVWSFLEAADKLAMAFPLYDNLSLNFAEPLPLAACGGGGGGGGGEVCSGRWLQLEMSAALQHLLSERLASLTLSGHTPYPLFMAPPPLPLPPPPPAPLISHRPSHPQAAAAAGPQTAAASQQQQQEPHKPHHRLQRSSRRASIVTASAAAAAAATAVAAGGAVTTAAETAAVAEVGAQGLEVAVAACGGGGVAAAGQPSAADAAALIDPWRGPQRSAVMGEDLTVADALRALEDEAAAEAANNGPQVTGPESSGEHCGGSGAAAVGAAPNRRRRRPSPAADAPPSTTAPPEAPYSSRADKSPNFPDGPPAQRHCRQGAPAASATATAAGKQELVRRDRSPGVAAAAPSAAAAAARSPVLATANPNANWYRGSSGSAPSHGSLGPRWHGGEAAAAAGYGTRRDADGSEAVGRERGASGVPHTPGPADVDCCCCGFEGPNSGGGGSAGGGDGGDGGGGDPMEVGDGGAALEALMEANGSGGNSDRSPASGDDNVENLAGFEYGRDPMDTVGDAQANVGFRYGPNHRSQPNSQPNATAVAEVVNATVAAAATTSDAMLLEENSQEAGGSGSGGTINNRGGGGSSDGNGSRRGGGAAAAVQTRNADCRDVDALPNRFQAEGVATAAAEDGSRGAPAAAAGQPASTAAAAAAVTRGSKQFVAADVIPAPNKAAAAGPVALAAPAAAAAPPAPPAPAPGAAPPALACGGGGVRAPPLLSRLSQLVSLTLVADVRFPSPQQLESITALRGLQRLDMRGAKFMQADGDASAPLGRQASWLHLGNEHVAVVARCTSLTALSLNHLHPVGGQQLVALTALSRLTALGLTDALSGNAVHGAHIQALAAGLPGLVSLDIGRVTCPPLHLPPQQQPQQQVPPPQQPQQQPPALCGGGSGGGGGETAAAGVRSSSPSANLPYWQPWGPVLGLFQRLTSLHLQIACSFETELLSGVAALPLLERLSMELLDVPPPQLAAMLEVLTAGGPDGSGGGADSGSPAKAAAAAAPPPHRHGRRGGGGGSAAAAAAASGGGGGLSRVLRGLTLTACMLYDEHLELMGRLRQLRRLRLDQVDIRTRDPDGWTGLSGARSLESFCFRVWNNPVLSASNMCVLTNDSLAMMAANWPKLQQLNYCGKVALTEKAEEHLAGMTALTSADISGTDGTAFKVWRSATDGQLLRSVTLLYNTTAKVSSRNGYVTYSDSDDSAKSEGSEASVNWMGEVGYVTSEYDAD